jgi:acyl-CoA thioester hydrolase
VLHFVVRRMICDFLRPAYLNDVLEVRTRLIGGSRVRLIARQEVHLMRRDEETGAMPQTGPIFTAEVTVAVIDDSGRPARLPTAAMETLTRLVTGAERAART